MLDIRFFRRYNGGVPHGPVAQLGAHYIRIVGVEGSNPFRSTRKKTSFVHGTYEVFFNEINPFGICEIRYACEIWLRHVKCAAAREGIYFISLDAQHPISQ